MRILIVIAAAFLIMLGTGAYAIDPPHESAVSCQNCHDSAALNRNPGGNIDNTPLNMMCKDCHDGVPATQQDTHSAQTLNSTLWGGAWTIECRVCHNPHYQMQSRTYKNTYAANGSWLVTGLLTSAAPVSNTVTMTVGGANPGWAVDKWKGYIFQPNKNYPFYFKIKTNTANTITTETAMRVGNAYSGPGLTFAISMGKLVKERINSPYAITNSSGAVLDSNTWRTVKFFNTVGSHSVAQNMTDTEAVCIVCHTRTKVNNIGYARFGQAFDATINPNYAGDIHNSRGSVTTTCWETAGCHKSHSEAFKADCSSCHGQPPIDAATLITNPAATGRASAGAHAAHNTAGITDCNKCHKGGGADGESTHTQGQFLTFGFAKPLTGATYTGPALANGYSLLSGAAGTAVATGANRTCSNIYCHSSAQSANGATTTPYQTAVPNWDTPASGACGTCHPNTTVGMTSGSHQIHFSNPFGITGGCDACHTGAAANGSTYSSTNHVNELIDVANTYSMGGAPGNGFGTCSNASCHDNGTGTPGTTPTWGNTVSNCSECHANQPSTGSHSTHITAGYNCGNCHDNAVQGTTAPTQHLDTNVDVFDTVAGDLGYPVNKAKASAYTTCNNMKCHGSNSDTWGTNLSAYNSCTKCHGQMAAAPTDAQKAPGGTGVDTNGDTAATDEEVGAHQIHLLSSSNYSNDIACTECHSVPGTIGAAGHIDSTLPAEVPLAGALATANTSTPSYSSVTGQCSNVYCHGAKMINGSTNGSNTAPIWNATAYLSGTPGDNNNGTGDCEKCHGAPPTGYVGSDHTGTETLANCYTCHTHVNAGGTFNNASLHIDGIVQATGCTGCHGQPPISVATLVNSNATLGTTGRETQFVGTAPGAHNFHVNTVGISDCATCHNGGGSGGQHKSATPTEVTMGFNINSVLGGIYNAPDFSDPDYNLGAGPSTTVTATGSTRVCSNIYCHSDGGNYAGTKSYKTPNWDTTYSYPADCNKCHGDATNKAITEKHPTHTSTYSFNCQECHSTTVDASNNIIGNHVNYAKNVSFGGSIATSGTYTRPTCSSVYCHSDGAGGAPGTAAKWDGTLPLPANCTGCHKNDVASGSSMTSGSHGAHINDVSSLIGRNLGCKDCHSDTVSDNRTISSTTLHVNTVKNIKVQIDNTACSNIKCHSNGNFDGAVTYNNPTWGVTSLNCTNCHGDGATKSYPSYADGGVGTGASNSHNKHVGTEGVACQKCHAMTTASGSSIDGTLPAAHVNQIANVALATGAYTAATETCSSTYCHGASGTPQWGGAALACNACHKANNTLAGRHNTHYNTLTNATTRTAANNSDATTYKFNCGVCHDNTTHAGGVVNANRAAQVIFNTTIAGSGTYAEGTLQGADSGFNWTNGTCSSTYCHSNGLGGAPNNTTFTWATAQGTFTCESCHNFNAAATNKMNSNRHTSHINNSATLGTNLGCQECHNTTTTDGATITNEVNHVNGSKNVSIVKGGTWATPNCTSTYCHSTGQATPTYVNRPWNTAINLDCKGCHGSVSSTYGEPDYANGAGTENSHSAHVSAASDCDKCHTDTTTTGTAIKAASTLHTNQSRNVNFNAAYDTNGGTNSDNYNSGTKTCSAITCHGTSGTPTWGATLACNACHGANNALPGKHAKHYGSATVATDRTAANSSSGTAYVFTCGVCHSATTHNGNVSGNQAAQVAFDGTYAVGGTYAAGTLQGNDNGFNWTNGTCSTTYCHSQGQSTTSPFGGAPNNTTFTWATAATVNCEGCHNYNAAATNKMSSGRHTSHINNSATLGTNIACQECHNTTTTDSTTITNELNHVNKTKNVGIASGGTWTTPNCTSAYCHSTGQATPTYVNRPWNTAINIDCKGCHGSVSSTYGEPDYANGGAGAATANSHSKHVSAATDCDKCHTDTTTTGTVIKAASTLHVNSTRNININATYDTNGGTNSDNYTVATKTCSAISCHGAGTPQWGGTVSCTDCHVGTGDVDDYTYNNGTNARIDSGEWTNYGHGNAVNGGSLTCEYCHSSGVNHGTGTNPFRLANYTAGTNSTCNQCHLTGSAGYNPGAGLKNSTKKIDKNHQMAAHTSSGNNGGKFCWDCHDPHGDDTNIKMIQDKAAKTTDGTYGIPATTNNGTNPVVFTTNAAGTGAGAFARTAGTYEAGICNTCHTNSLAAPKMIHYNNTASDSHNSGQVCTTCHKHSANATQNGDAFKGGGCNGCHGYPPDPDIDGGGPDTNDGKAYLGTGNEGKGAHPKHVTHLLALTGYTLTPDTDTFTSAKVAAICGVCHNTSADTNHTTDGTANNSRQMLVPTSYQFGPTAPAYGGLPNTSSTVNFKSCSNVSCHFKESPGWQDPATAGQ